MRLDAWVIHDAHSAPTARGSGSRLVVTHIQLLAELWGAAIGLGGLRMVLGGTSRPSILVP